MAELKVTKSIEYTVGGRKRTATHEAILTYTTTKIGNDTVFDMKTLNVTGSYEGGGGDSDGSINGEVRVKVHGNFFIRMDDQFKYTSYDSAAERRFREERANALTQHGYYGLRLSPTTLQYEVEVILAITVYDPQSGSYKWGTSTSYITIQGTGIAKIKGKPTSKVSKLTNLKRASNGSRLMSSTWDIPKALSNEVSPYHAEGLRLNWELTTGSTKNKKRGSLKATSWHSGLALKSGSLNPSNFTASNGKSYTRESYYPFTTRTILSMSLSVVPTNSKGNGPAAKVTREFVKPKKPSVTAITQNEETGKVSCTIKSDLGHGYAERYDTRYLFTVYDTSKPKGKRTVLSVDDTFTGASKSLSYDISDRMQLKATDYVRVKVRAWSRGYAGSSDVVERVTYVGWPLKPSIKSITVPKAKTEAALLAEKATVAVRTAATKEHPVTGIKLEKLVDVPYTKASDIPGNAGWEEAGSVDNGRCTALSVTVGEIMPQAGNRTWLRLKSWNAIEGIFKVYSAPMQVSALYRKAPTAADDTVRIASVTDGGDGRSAIVVLAWNNDDSTGTEVSWSDDENAWRSTNPPSTYNVTESDGSMQIGSRTYANSYTLHVQGLTEETTYHFRARRYREGDVDTFGRYYPSNTSLAVTPLKIPESCTVNMPPYVERGKSVEVTWTYDGSATQKRWALVMGPVTATVDSNGLSHYAITKEKIIASGVGQSGSHVISAERLASLVKSGNGIYLAAKVSVSGSTADYVTSEAKLLRVADAPEIAVSVGTVTEQPMSVTVGCDMESDLSVVVSAQGADGEWPDGPRSQQDGDAIWSGLVEPEWESVTTDDSNLLTNKPSAWERSTFDENGNRQESTYEVSLSDEQAVQVVAGSPYTVSLDNNEYEIAIISLLNGEFVDGEQVAWTASPLTFTTTTANSVIVRVRHTDETVEMLVDEVGSDVKVKLEAGSVATEWTPFANDVLRYSTSVTLPDSLDLWDEADYRVVVKAIARDTGLTSEETTVQFSVNYSRKAPEPSSLTTVDVADEVGSDDRRTRSASINLAAPDGIDPTDLCDLYRVTADGPRLLIAGVQPDAVVMDKWAPFGSANLAYRVAIKTKDGSIEWIDIPYSFGESSVFQNEVRIDFGDEYVEIERNVAASSTYKKDFESRTHLDGTTNGYWNDGVTRTGSMSGVMLRVYDNEKIRRLRALAAHIGPTFVRTGDGVAYEADTQVSISMSSGTAAASVSIDATEVMASQYLGTVYDASESQQGDESEGQGDGE